MSEQSNISWTDSTWNPWRGCSKVSPGCQNCYAEKLVTSRLHGEWGPGKPRVMAETHTRNAPLRWNKKPFVCDECGEAQANSGYPPGCPTCGNSKFHRRRVFFGSLMDWLDPEVPGEWLADALDIIRRCPDLTFQCVTKRPELFTKRMREVIEFAYPKRDAGFRPLYEWTQGWLNGSFTESIPKNVHVIASVEDQRRADERIPALLSIPAAVRGVSVEPLLEPINIERAFVVYDKHGEPAHVRCEKDGSDKIKWVIVGGESGPNRRDCGVDAIVSIAEQCQDAGVPVFIKQDCAAKPGQQGRIPDAVWKLKQFP